MPADDELFRYDRVRAVQKTGETTRDLWHKTDWSKVKDDPESIGFPREDWIHTFDAEKHAEEVFDEVFKKHTGESDNEGAPVFSEGQKPTLIAV
jgi:hypothetical protein